MSSENTPHAKSQTRMMLGRQPGSSFLWPKNAQPMQCEILIFIRLHSKYVELFTLRQPVNVKLKKCITSEFFFCF